jgi:hypothetical protein
MIPFPHKRISQREYFLPPLIYAITFITGRDGIAQSV